MTYQPVMTPVSMLRLDEHNPREVDPIRLEEIGASLRKLGFLLPIYATEDGMVLSGHQRLTASISMGIENVPVVTVSMRSKPDESIGRLNYLFNRATNDFAKTSRPKTPETTPMWEDLSSDTKSFFRCMDPEMCSVQDLKRALPPGNHAYMALAAALYREYKTVQPVIIEGDRIVNGVGRVAAAVHLGLTDWPVVIVQPHEADYASACLNDLSMEYSYEGKIGDQLRYGARRLPMLDRGESSRVTGVQTMAIRPVPKAHWDVRRPENAKLWTRAYGYTVLDFGAGTDKSSEVLRHIGVEVDTFEPFVCPPSRKGTMPSRTVSLPGIEKFLASVQRGTQWHSIFVNGIMQAIPFDDDRQKVITILSALCGPKTTLYAATLAPETIGYKQKMAQSNFLGIQRLDDSGIESVVQTSSFKTQALFPEPYWAGLFTAGFQSVKVKHRKNLEAIARSPIPVDKARLREAIEFEFNLPYPDGERMDLVDVALQAFEQRLEVSL